MKLNICLTNYNRTDLLIESFKDVYDDDRIEAIVISDDESDIGVYRELESVFRYMPKVKMFRNEKNQDCYKNKAIAVGLSTTDYLVIIDSDNKIDKGFIDKIYEHEWSADKILMPEFALPLFDYTAYAGLTITKQNVAQYMGLSMFDTCLNCMNFFVNKHTYLNAFDPSVDPVTADSIFMSYRLLEQGNKIHITEGLRYQHLVHSGSHYQNNNHRTGDFYSVIENKLRNMK